MAHAVALLGITSVSHKLPQNDRRRAPGGPPGGPAVWTEVR